MRMKAMAVAVRRVVVWAGLALVLSPIFVSFPGFDILLLKLLDPSIPRASYDSAISLLSIFIAALGFTVAIPFVRGVFNRRPFFLAAVAVILYFLTLGTIGARRSEDFFPILGAIQYGLPVAAVVIGYLVHERRRLHWAGLLALFTIVNLLLPLAVFVFVHLRIKSRIGLLDSLTVTNRYFYALYSHLPAMVLVACVLALGLTGRRRLLPMALFSTIAGSAALFVTWSRAATLAAIVALLLYTILTGFLFFSRKTGDLRISFVGSCVFLAACVVVPRLGLIEYRRDHAINRPPERVAAAPRAGDNRRTTESRLSTRAVPAKLRGRARSAVATRAGAWTKSAVPARFQDRASENGPARRGSPEDVSSGPAVVPDLENPVTRDVATSSDGLAFSTTVRLWYMREGLRRFAEAPVFGIMFTPDEVSIIHRKVVHKKQIFQSHSQYIDILLKTGIVGFLLLAWFYIWFVIRPLWNAFQSSTGHEQKLVYGNVLCVLAGIAVAANFQLYLTVWTTAVPLGFLMGAMVARAEGEGRVADAPKIDGLP